MDMETLERLLMDQALGALTPDVEALLNAYLEQQPEAADRAREYRQATVAAKQALGAATVPLPAYPAARIEKLAAARRRLVVVRNVAGLAAAVVIGIGLGGWLSRAREQKPAASPVVIAQATEALPSQARHGVAEDTFWSSRRLMDDLRPRVVPVSRNTPGYTWHSPFRVSKVGDES